MKLVGDLKDKVEKAENQEEAKKIIKDAGLWGAMRQIKGIHAVCCIYKPLHISYN